MHIRKLGNHGKILVGNSFGAAHPRWAILVSIIRSNIIWLCDYYFDLYMISWIVIVMISPRIAWEDIEWITRSL